MGRAPGGRGLCWAELVMVAAVMAWPTTARSEPTPRQPTGAVHARTLGFLRLELGLSQWRFKPDLPTEQFQLEENGVGADLALQLGIAPRSGLLVFGELSASRVPDPDDRTIYFGDTSGNLGFRKFTMASLGAGVAFFFGQSPFYFAATLALSQLSAAPVGSAEQGLTDWGPTGVARLGADFRVAGHLCLGIAGRIVVASLKERPLYGAEGRGWTATAWGLVASAALD